MTKEAFLQLVFCVLAVGKFHSASKGILTTELKKTTVPLIIAYCPPLTKAWNDLETINLDYFVVRSQADADKLKTCYTFKGELFIYGTNASAPLIIDGPREIEEMTIETPFSTTDNPLLTSR
jgi:hypothetical protein